MTVCQGKLHGYGQHCNMHRKYCWANTVFQNYVPSYMDREKQPKFSMCKSALLSDVWWLRVLAINATPREIPNQSTQRSVFRTNSDREGSSACVGVAGWRTTLKTPLAAFLKVPREGRTLWSLRHEFVGSTFRDIHEIEAIGPLAMLATGRKPVDPLHRQCGGSGVACL